MIEAPLAEPRRVGFAYNIEIMTAREDLAGAVTEIDASPWLLAGLPTIELILDIPDFGSTTLSPAVPTSRPPTSARFSPCRMMSSSTCPLTCVDVGPRQSRAATA